MQFIPKTAPESNPLDNELTKHPKCPYCGMDRTKWHHSRHLVQYDDGLVDGTCSIHCLAGRSDQPSVLRALPPFNAAI